MSVPILVAKQGLQAPGTNQWSPELAVPRKVLLSMKPRTDAKGFTSAEAILPCYGFGTYSFSIRSLTRPFAKWDPHLVAAAFLWGRDESGKTGVEMTCEVGRFGQATRVPLTATVYPEYQAGVPAPSPEVDLRWGIHPLRKTVEGLIVWEPAKVVLKVDGHETVSIGPVPNRGQQFRLSLWCYGTVQTPEVVECEWAFDHYTASEVATP